MKNCIVYASNFNDINFLILSLKTVRKNNKDIDIYILTDNILLTDKVQSTLNIFNVTFIDCKKFFDKIFNSYLIQGTNIQYSIFTFYRLIIPLVPNLKQYENILYIDTDTLVVKNINIMFDIDTNKPYILFYNRKHDNKELYNKYILKVYKKLYSLYLFDTLNLTYSYDNAGVIVFKNSIFQKIYLEKWKKMLNNVNNNFNKKLFPEYDQTILNLCFDHYTYNSRLLFNSNEFNEKLSYIIHYFGPNKKQLLSSYKDNDKISNMLDWNWNL